MHSASAVPAPRALSWREPNTCIDGQLLERAVRIRAQLGPQSQLAFPDGTRLSLDASKAQIQIHQSGPWLESIVIGPALLMLLAELNKFCLHASAFASPRGTWLVLASSGTGKSTLARTAMGMGWTRLADDLCVIGVEASGEATLYAHFPQPKLSNHEQYPEAAPAQLPIAGIAVLTRGAAGQAVRVQGVAALHALIAHSVATRLLTCEQLGRHLQVCGALAACVPIWRVCMRDAPDAPESAAQEALQQWPR